MAAFRILNQAPQYFLPDGRVNAGGKLFFYETDLSTPRDTWSDEAMTTLNSNPVIMDAAGRTLTDVWGFGEYGVVMTTSADVEIWTRNNVQASGDPGVSIPALEDGKFLTNNAAVLLWADILQVPDMTGESGKFLTNDGTLSFWEALDIPDVPATGIETGTKLFRIGNLQIIAGVETMPITGTHTTTKAVVFPTPFSASPYFVVVSNTTGGITPLGAQGTITAQGQSATGFTINHDVNINSSDSGWNISIAAVNQWLAFGPVTA